MVSRAATRRVRLRVLVLCWLAAWIGAVALVATIAPRWARFYRDAGFELGWAVERTLQLGEVLGSPPGAILAALLLGLGLLPLRLARGSPALAWWFGGGALVAVVLGVLAWLLLETPLVNIHWNLGPATPFQLAIRARPGRFLATLVFGVLFAVPPGVWLLGLALAWGWLRKAIAVHRLPRGPLGEEVVRAFALSWFPMLVLGTLAGKAGRMADVPDVLLVPPPFAAAGTVVVVLYLAALGLRLQRPAPDDVSAPSPPT